VCMCAVEVCLQNSVHINSLDFAVGSCFSEIFCVKSRETIAECMQLFDCQFVKHAADKRRHSFIQKYSASRTVFVNRSLSGETLRAASPCRISLLNVSGKNRVGDSSCRENDLSRKRRVTLDTIIICLYMCLL